MDGYRYYGSGKRYYVTNHALGGSQERQKERPFRRTSEGFRQDRQWKYRRSVDGERLHGQNGYDIAEGACYMADLEFGEDGVLIGIRYDLVRPARKV